MRFLMELALQDNKQNRSRIIRIIRQNYELVSVT